MWNEQLHHSPGKHFYNNNNNNPRRRNTAQPRHLLIWEQYETEKKQWSLSPTFLRAQLFHHYREKLDDERRKADTPTNSSNMTLSSCTPLYSHTAGHQQGRG